MRAGDTQHGKPSFNGQYSSDRRTSPQRSFQSTYRPRSQDQSATVGKYVAQIQNQPNPQTGYGEEASTPVPSHREALASPPSSCEPHQEQILKWLDAGLSIRRIHQDPTGEHGFSGSYYSVWRFVSRLQDKSPLPFRRVETNPGEELQIDFGTAPAIIGPDGKTRRPWMLRLVLNHSRKAYSELVYRQTTDSFIAVIENAFEYFGGIPKRLLIDNFKAAVAKADWYEPELHPKLQSSSPMILDVGIQAAEARGHAHHRDVVHRDVEPSSLIVDRKDRVPLTFSFPYFHGKREILAIRRLWNRVWFDHLVVHHFLPRRTNVPQPNAPDWGKVIEKHAERVFRIAYRILGSVHDAEDISQEVFTEAMAVHQTGPIRTWTGLMVRLATVRSIDRLRKDQRRPEPLPNVDLSPSTTDRPDQELIAAELATWLRGEIRLLPDQQAAIFSLAYFEQLSRDEIATALGVSPEAVSTTLYKARKKLFSRLAVVHGEKS